MSADFWAGYLSCASSIVIGNPLDLVKVRLQAGPVTSATVASPHAWHSVKTLAAGLPAPIMTYGALNALLFTSYNRSLALLPRNERTETTSLTYPLYSHFAAGALAGIATWFISTPTEFVKCRAQVAEQATTNSRRRSPASSWSTAAQTFRHKGIRGFFLGGTVTCVRDAVGYGFWFATYEGMTELLRRGKEDSAGPAGAQMSTETLNVLLCGGLAGVATWASIFPLDVIKTRVQTQRLPWTCEATLSSETPLLQHEQKQTVRGAWSMSKEAYRQEGLKVFWRGMGVCCLRAFIVNAAQWLVYEWTMRALSQT